MQTNKQLAIQIKAFRETVIKHGICQIDLYMCIYIGFTTIPHSDLAKHSLDRKLGAILQRGYIEQVQGKGKRFRVSDKGKDVLNQYYSLVAKLSEVKPTKQATHRLIDSI